MSKTIKLGTVRTNKKGNRSLVLSKGIEITYNGTPITLDQFRSALLLDSVESVQRLAAANYITQEESSKQLQYINDKNIKFDVVIFPPKQG